MLYVRFPLSLRNVEDLLHERGIDVSHETVRFWWNCFGPMLPLPHRQTSPTGQLDTPIGGCPCLSVWMGLGAGLVDRAKAAPHAAHVSPPESRVILTSR